MSKVIKKKAFQGPLFLMLASPISLFLSLTAQRWLPEQFHRDSLWLHERLIGSVTGYSDSFSILSDLYGFLSISLNPTLLSILQWGIAVLPLILISRIVDEVFDDVKSTLIAGLYLMLIPVYLSSYSKEFPVVLSINLILLSFWKFKGEAHRVLSFLSIVLTLTIIRPYYFLTVLCTLIFAGIVWRIQRKWVPITLLLATTIISTFEAITKIGMSLSGLNILNLRFNVVNNSPIRANSSVFAEVYSSSFFENLWINIKVMFSIIIPFDLSQINSYNVVATFITWLMIFSYYSQFTSNRNESLSLRVLTSFLLSYLLVALIFEPDVGSFNRHSFVWLPLIVLLSSTRRSFTRNNVTE